MKVALDATPLLGVRTGVGAFCAGALAALAERTDLDVGAFAVSWRRRGELDRLLPPGVHNVQRAMPARPLHVTWSHLSGPPVEWFIGPVDVVHGTNYVVPPARRAARVVTVHDLTTVRFPELCDAASLQFPRLVRRAARSGAWVHTPSRFVAQEVVAELGVDPARVRPVHHGIPGVGPRGVDAYIESADEDRRRREGEGESHDQLPNDFLPRDARRYVLGIGTIEPRKDYPALVRAFDVATQRIDDVALVIAGADGWGTSAFERALDGARRRDRVVRLGYVAPQSLSSLLAGAAAVAYPSVYEGFGFVPLEAMAAGIPVVATAAGAIPEVVADGALLVAPGDDAALAEALVTVLCDEASRSALVERGRLRAASFTWEACAEGLAELYAAAADD
ncbi:MAG TPA: glycosyltransferase family 1 protein [Acidimicrobiales bacterium]|nr:glycosyltransferase family 1 protein [Acidimicrobiales bacterium]